MKHQEKIRMVIERVHIDNAFKERVMKIHTEKDFLKLLAEMKIVLEPDEIEKYFKGFLKLQEMEKTEMFQKNWKSGLPDGIRSTIRQSNYKNTKLHLNAAFLMRLLFGRTTMSGFK